MPSPCAAMLPHRKSFVNCPGASRASGRVRLFAAPALCRVVIRCSRLHPASTPWRFLFLPKRRAGLEVVHDEFAGGKGLAAVSAGDHYEHDLIGGLQLADAV